MIKDFLIELEKKWGPFSHKENYIYSGAPAYVEADRYFNYIFDPISEAKYSEYAKAGGFELPVELKEVYAECNGMRLFLSSFSIYGFQNHSDVIEPFDLDIENHNNRSRFMRKIGNINNYFFFGAFGRDYVFAYNLKSPNKILCMENESGKLVLAFNSVKELFMFFLPRLISLYDQKCCKIVPNKDFASIPILSNTTYRIEEMLVSNPNCDFV